MPLRPIVFRVADNVGPRGCLQEYPMVLFGLVPLQCVASHLAGEVAVEFWMATKNLHDFLSFGRLKLLPGDLGNCFVA